jgi:hypothetical protein
VNLWWGGCVWGVGRGGRTRPDLRNPSDSSESEPDPIWFFKKVKLIRFDPNPTRPDPTRDQMVFNPIKIYQRSKKTQHINWPDPIRPDPISFRKSNWPDPSDLNPTRPIATSRYGGEHVQVSRGPCTQSPIRAHRHTGPVWTESITATHSTLRSLRTSPCAYQNPLIIGWIRAKRIIS